MSSPEAVGPLDAFRYASRQAAYLDSVGVGAGIAENSEHFNHYIREVHQLDDYVPFMYEAVKITGRKLLPQEDDVSVKLDEPLGSFGIGQDVVEEEGIYGGFTVKLQKVYMDEEQYPIVIPRAVHILRTGIQFALDRSHNKVEIKHHSFFPASGAEVEAVEARNTHSLVDLKHHRFTSEVDDVIFAESRTDSEYLKKVQYLGQLFRSLCRHERTAGMPLKQQLSYLNASEFIEHSTINSSTVLKVGSDEEVEYNFEPHGGFDVQAESFLVEKAGYVDSKTGEWYPTQQFELFIAGTALHNPTEQLYVPVKALRSAVRPAIYGQEYVA